MRYQPSGNDRRVPRRHVRGGRGQAGAAAAVAPAVATGAAAAAATTAAARPHGVLLGPYPVVALFFLCDECVWLPPLSRPSPSLALPAHVHPRPAHRFVSAPRHAPCAATAPSPRLSFHTGHKQKGGGSESPWQPGGVLMAAAQASATVAPASTMEQVKKAASRALGGGIAGAAAMAVQVVRVLGVGSSSFPAPPAAACRCMRTQGK